MQNIRYDYDQLNELCAKIDLLEYAERSYEFRRRGDKYFCSCPKHSDSDPSLCISPDVNLFFCFSCGRKGNLINWLMEFEDLSFYQAVEKVANLTGEDINEYVESETVNFYKQLEKIYSTKQRDSPDRIVLDIDKDYKQRFKNEMPIEWIEEGISAETMKKYEIMVDPVSNRIVYPVYDRDFRLIGIKGRTRFKNFKDLKIMKYMNYTRVGILDYFTGMKQAADYIDETKEVIIVEGLKSVMKLDQWGFHNVVSAETSTLNDYQIELLIRMQVKKVVVAFDKDVPLKKIRECTGLLGRFTNCYAVIDKWKLLKEKDSPPDQGREVWMKLYERKVRL